MADELKPCPNCGGEAVIAVDADNMPPFFVWCKKCHAGTAIRSTKAEAVELWNTRYERTCHMVEQPDGCGSYDDVCSECGAFDSGTPYCWNCGAKVVW